MPAGSPFMYNVLKDAMSPLHLYAVGALRVMHTLTAALKLCPAALELERVPMYVWCRNRTHHRLMMPSGFAVSCLQCSLVSPVKAQNIHGSP